jgi:uncharacterized membrane protein
MQLSFHLVHDFVVLPGIRSVKSTLTANLYGWSLIVSVFKLIVEFIVLVFTCVSEFVPNAVEFITDHVDWPEKDSGLENMNSAERIPGHSLLPICSRSVIYLPRFVYIASQV